MHTDYEQNKYSKWGITSIAPIYTVSSAWFNRFLSRSEFIAFVALHIVVNRFLCHLFVVLFHRGQILSGLSELARFHSLSDVPVHEGPLCVHQVELVVHPAHHLGDGRGVTDHQHRPLHFGQVSSRNHGGRLVVNAQFEPGGAPIHEPDGPLCFHRTDGRIHVLWHHVPAVHHATRHILTMARVAFHHLVSGLKH